MTRPAHTGVLLVALLGVGVADVAVRSWGRPTTATLEGLPAVDPATVDRIEIGRVDLGVVITRGESGWTLGTGEAADGASVDALLRRFTDPIRPESVVDDGRYETYGLAGGDERRLALWGADTLLRSVWVGHDTPDGTTFARLDDDPSVVRVDVGTGALLQRTASQWLDRQIVDLDPATVDQLTLSWSGESLVVDRLDDSWRSAQPTDAAAVQAVVRRLATLRGRQALGTREVEAGIDVVLRTASGTVALGVGRGPQGPEVARDGRTWTLSPTDPLWDALQPGALLDRRLVVVAPDRVEALDVEGARGGRVERVPQGWFVVQPAGVDVDPARVEAAVARIATWRAEFAAPAGDAEAYVVTGRVTLEAGAERHTLELGRTVETAAGARTQVRSRSMPQRVAWVDPADLAEIRAIFGR